MSLKSKVILSILGACTVATWAAAVSIYLGSQAANTSHLHALNVSSVKGKDFAQLTEPVVGIQKEDIESTSSFKLNSVSISDDSNKVSIDVLLELIDKKE